eukprot:GFKZ01004908.1.p1 GENE.GFKZ01004908.1~~GFKZ01004908.1.p1  ORF type:complete len:591 (+),score=83.83 GFKZ01004908.1:73-1773(+)
MEPSYNTFARPNPASLAGKHLPRSVIVLFLVLLVLLFVTFTFLPSPYSLKPQNLGIPSISESDTLPPFIDVTDVVGLHDQKDDAEQFGGATIVDLDSDGHYDLILTYHTRYPLRIYYGNSLGTFDRERSFVFKQDVHGVAVAQRTAHSNDKILAVPIGGGGGTNLKEPYIFLFNSTRHFVNISNDFGFGQAAARGRVPVWMDLSMRTENDSQANLGGPDLLLVNLLGVNTPLTHHAYENVLGNYTLQGLPNFGRINEERAIVTDVDNDGVMELVHFSVLTMWKLIGPFEFEDVTRQLWPEITRRFLRRTVSGVVELDFDNDGWMDLYVARANSSLVTPRGPPSVDEFADILLKNIGGERYLDVTGEYGIGVQGVNSIGVSAEDFDNDGWVDVIVSTFEGPDILWRNLGGKGFERMDPGTNKEGTRRGASVMAFDYDADGRMDYIVGQGWRKEFFGNFRLMQSGLELDSAKGFIFVKVGNDNNLATTSLNALVTVVLPDRPEEKLIRRVGGRGAALGGSSYIDTVHFGIGSATTGLNVTVRWTSGAVQEMFNVTSGETVSFGVFSSD